MQKWLPDAFVTDNAPLAKPAAASGVFEPVGTGEEPSPDSAVSRFRSESGFSDTQTFLKLLTRKERAQLFELVEQDVASEYETREKEMQAKLVIQTKSLEDTFQMGLANLATELESAVAEQLKEISAASARLAVQLAERIVRKTVTLDQEVLTRTLAATQHKLQDKSSLTVILNPEDAFWLEARPEMVKELKISKVQTDRRIERGGCVIKSDNQEWDATIARQIESFTEIIEEAIATSPEPGTILHHEEPHEPEVE